MVADQTAELEAEIAAIMDDFMRDEPTTRPRAYSAFGELPSLRGRVTTRPRAVSDSGLDRRLPFFPPSTAPAPPPEATEVFSPSDLDDDDAVTPLDSPLSASVAQTTLSTPGTAATAAGGAGRAEAPLISPLTAQEKTTNLLAIIFGGDQEAAHFFVTTCLPKITHSEEEAIGKTETKLTLRFEQASKRVVTNSSGTVTLRVPAEVSLRIHYETGTIELDPAQFTVSYSLFTASLTHLSYGQTTGGLFSLTGKWRSVVKTAEFSMEDIRTGLGESRFVSA